jgi:hypothetical protein
MWWHQIGRVDTTFILSYLPSQRPPPAGSCLSPKSTRTLAHMQLPASSKKYNLKLVCIGIGDGTILIVLQDDLVQGIIKLDVKCTVQFSFGFSGRSLSLSWRQSWPRLNKVYILTMAEAPLWVILLSQMLGPLLRVLRDPRKRIGLTGNQRGHFCYGWHLSVKNGGSRCKGPW